jgi:hypothetical protein
MFTKLALFATALLFASSVESHAHRYGKIDILIQNGTVPHGCVGPNMLWNIDGDCATYMAEREDAMAGEGKDAFYGSHKSKHPTIW